MESIRNLVRVRFVPLPSKMNSCLISSQTYDWEMIRITSSSNQTDFRLNPWVLEKERLEEQFFRQHISAIKATGLLDPSIEKNQ